jgi:hypothetical protein
MGTVSEAKDGDLLIMVGCCGSCIVFDRKLGDAVHKKVLAALKRENEGTDGGEFERLVEKYAFRWPDENKAMAEAAETEATAA